MDISVVIPTCNRKSRLLSLLDNLNNSTLPPGEVIIVDSGEEPLAESEKTGFGRLNIIYILSEKSVCIQRNKGINAAKNEWIFLCDDDIEVPGDYLMKLTPHLAKSPHAGAVCGLWLQKENDRWVGSYPFTSANKLFWNFIFQFAMWGEIKCSTQNILIKKIKQFYAKKGNHIAKSGWPVLTNFSGEHFTTPVYSLGACLIKKKWLLDSPFDETLDRHGIGDNYGVIAGFPGRRVHVLNNACIYHHHEPSNRLQESSQYYRRILALNYFIKTKHSLKQAKTRWLIWSLVGHLLKFIFSGNGKMIKANLRSIWIILSGTNPYIKAAKQGLKIVEPPL